MTSAPGVLRDRNDPSTLVTFADPDDLASLLSSSSIAGGMRPKVEACIRAATGGVERTHIIDGGAPDSLLFEVFTGAGCGTMIVGRKEKATYLGESILPHSLASSTARLDEVQLLRELVQIPSVPAKKPRLRPTLKDCFPIRPAGASRRCNGRHRAAERQSRQRPCARFTPGHRSRRTRLDATAFEPPTVEGDRIYGRGANDAKASCAAMIGARSMCFLRAVQRRDACLSCWVMAKKRATPACRGRCHGSDRSMRRSSVSPRHWIWRSHSEGF